MIPAFLAVVGAAALGGATLGGTVGTSGMVDRGIGTGAPEKFYTAGNSMTLADQGNHPDQYAIVTPEGRFGTGELSSRGLYSQARFATDAYFVDDFDPAHYPGDEAFTVDLADHTPADEVEVHRGSDRAEQPRPEVICAADSAGMQNSDPDADEAAPAIAILSLN